MSLSPRSWALLSPRSLTPLSPRLLTPLSPRSLTQVRFRGWQGVACRLGPAAALHQSRHHAGVRSRCMFIYHQSFTPSNDALPLPCSYASFRYRCEVSSASMMFLRPSSFPLPLSFIAPLHAFPFTSIHLHPTLCDSIHLFTLSNRPTPSHPPSGRQAAEKPNTSTHTHGHACSCRQVFWFLECHHVRAVVWQAQVQPFDKPFAFPHVPQHLLQVLQEPCFALSHAK